MIKVCIIATENQLYDGRVYWREAVSLVKNNYDVTYIGLDDDKEEKSGITEEGIKFYKINLKNLLYKYSFFKSILNDYGYWNKRFDNILEILLSSTFDIIHIHGLYSIFIIEQLKFKLKNTKIIYECREYYPDAIRDYNKTSGIKSMNKYLYSYYMDIIEKIKVCRFDQIIATDDSIFNRFKKFNSRKMEIVYNFTDIKPIHSVDMSKKEYDIIYCGGVTKVRGIMQIIKAVNLAKKNGYELKFLLIGSIVDKNFENEIYEYINRFNLEDNIIIKGFVEYKYIPQYLEKSRIGMVTLMPIPKYMKNIPMKQFEYMAYGLPIVGSKLPPIEKFVNEADCGLLVDPTDEKNIWSAIEKILSDNELFDKMSRNGIKAANEKFNWKQSENKLLNVYKNLTKN